MAEPPPRLIHLEEEIEGEYEPTTDFVFCRIGHSVPLKPSDSQFDLQDPPSRPLAISERFRVLFLAHSEGFLVARTKDVIGLGKEIKEKGRGPCIQNSCVADVNLGRVYLLALSNDSSVLAAAVGEEIHFFYVPSLLQGLEHKPSFSCLLKNSSKIKDLKWQKNSQKSYLVLMTDGLLCHGHIKDPLENVLENVDAVDWSTEGDFFAVARKRNLSIFSSDIKEQICISLLFQLWDNDAESGSSIKVDSIEWVREDSIVVGFFRVNEDGNEEGYLVQVITCGEKKFTESSCKPVVFSFPDLFSNASDDILPTGAGPYLHLSYLDRWELLLASSKKNYDQHIVPLKYSVDDSQRVVSRLEFINDNHNAIIETQENGDDNLILGFGIDKVSLYEKVEVLADKKTDEQTKELSPFCVLFCITCEGKLSMFHTARISDPSDLPGSSLTHADIPLEEDLFPTNSKLKNDGDLISNARSEQITIEAPSVPTSNDLKSTKREEDIHEVPKDNIQSGKVNERHDSICTPPVGQPTNIDQLFTNSSPKSGPAYIDGKRNIMADTVSSIGRAVTIPPSANNISSEAAMTRPVNVNNSIKVGDQNEGTLNLVRTEGVTSKSQSHGLLRSDGTDAKLSSSFKAGTAISGSGDKSLAGWGRTSSSQKSLSSNLMSDNISLNLKGASGGSPAGAFSGSFPLQENPVISKSLLSKAQPVINLRNSKSLQMLDSEPELSKQFYIVNDMIKELDNMLLLIEQEGGFRDACTVFQQNSLLTLEEGLKNISKISKICTINLEEELLEIQELQRKMLQVSTKQVYMAAVVKQVSNNQYWGIWNKQKLSPEIETKKQHIWKAYQDLTNHLIGLEKHFNNLEISKFGRSDSMSEGQRAFPGNLRQSRNIQYLHSLYNTLNSQLAVAEQQSEFLSNQMALLNINNTSTKRTGVARELFESIGLADEDISLKSPFVKHPFSTPDSIKRISASPDSASKEHPRKALTSAVPESMRRRRESLERNWAGFEPPKTVVKRMTQQEHIKASPESPFRIAKKQFDSQIEAFTISQQKTIGTQASLAEPLTSKVQPEVYDTVNKDIQGNPFQQFSRSSASPVFKWANEPSGTPQTLMSKSHLMEETKRGSSQTSVTLPQMSSRFPSGSLQTSGLKNQSLEEIHKMPNFTSVTMAPSPSLFNSGSSGPKESKISTLITSSPMKSVSAPKAMPNVQMEAQNLVTSLKIPSSTSPPKITSTEVKAKENKQLNAKSFGEGFSWNLQGSTGAFPQSSSALLSKSGSSFFSAASSAAPSVLSKQSDQTETITSKENLSGIAPALMSHAKAASPQPPFSTSDLSSPFSTSAVSGSSLPTLAIGRLSPSHANNIGENNVQLSVSTSTSAQNPVSKSSLSTLAIGRSSPSHSNSIGETNVQHSLSTTTSAQNPVSFSTTQSQLLGSVAAGPTTSGTALLQKPLSPLNGAHSKSEPTPGQASSPDQITLKVEPVTSQSAANVGLTGLSIRKEPDSLPTGGSIISSLSSSQPEIKAAAAPLESTISTDTNDGLDINSSQEEEMEEEVSDPSSMLNLGALGGFGLGSASTSSAPKPNPFGSSFASTNASTEGTSLTLAASSGQLFRPASFSLPTAQPAHPSVSGSPNAFSGGSTSGFSGFGQPSQIGAGQQALGTVLGAFGQSRQIGPGGFNGRFSSGSEFSGTNVGGRDGFSALASRSGGFAGGAATSNSSGWGFGAMASSPGGFAGAAAQGSGGGGFAGAAAQGSGGGGFAGAAAQGGGGGFAGAAAQGGGGFAGAAAQGGGGFGGAGMGGGTKLGGFGAFSSNQGGAFSAFGGSSAPGTGRPPSELFTQMRR